MPLSGRYLADGGCCVRRLSILTPQGKARAFMDPDGRAQVFHSDSKPAGDTVSPRPVCHNYSLSGTETVVL